MESSNSKIVYYKEIKNKRTKVGKEGIAKANLRKKSIAKRNFLAFLAGMGITAACSALYLGPQLIDEAIETATIKNEIAQNIFEYTDGYSIRDSGVGFVATLNGVQVNLDDAIKDIARDAIYNKNSIVEVAIGLIEIFPGIDNNYIMNVLNELNSEEIINNGVTKEAIEEVISNYSMVNTYKELISERNEVSGKELQAELDILEQTKGYPTNTWKLNSTSQNDYESIWRLPKKGK